MSSEISVAGNMETIRTIFRQVQDTFSGSADMALLHSFEEDFRGIAYEAASMGLALADLKAGEELRNWNNFFQTQGRGYGIQIHIGLGWALAQEQIDPAPFLPPLQPILRYRVLDGYGYYEGTFRKRKSVLSQQGLNLPDATATGAYYQGLGRSLWYTCGAKAEEVKQAIDKFPAERQRDLWRGAGIAVAYVGGASEPLLQSVLTAAHTYHAALKAGAVMALVSREQANFIMPDTALCCNTWTGKTATDLLSINRQLLSEISLNAPNAYAWWIEKLEGCLGLTTA